MEFVFRFSMQCIPFAYFYVVGNFKYVIYYDSSGECVCVCVYVCLSLFMYLI